MEHKLYDSIYIKSEGNQNQSLVKKKIENNGCPWVGNFNFKGAQGTFKEMETFFILLWLMVTWMNVIKTQWTV